MPERGEASRGLIAAATGDPFDIRTFSGLSAHLFAAMGDQGVKVHPISTRQLRWTDALTGAVAPTAIMARGAQRGRPRVRPSWYWSRRSFDRFSSRFDRSLTDLGSDWPILQVGTHVLPRRSAQPMFCITDMTVVQALQSTQFSVSKAPVKVVRQAIDVQARVFDHCEAIFVLSEWTARSVVDDYDVARDRVVVTGAGANLRERLPRRHDPERPYVLFVGLDWETKGGPLLLDAVRLVRRRHPELRLKVVGCSPPLSEPGVDVVGFLNKATVSGRAELLRLYVGATCLCLLSQVDAFPNVLLEAGYMGVPVVSTDEGSRPEVVVPGETGLLVHERDPASVASAIESLLADPYAVESMGAAARRRADERYTWAAVSARILRHIGLLDPRSDADRLPPPVRPG